MGGKVIVFDTSILCVWLQVPGKESCGATTDPWDFKRVADLIQKEEKAGSTFVLPMAAIIETGNHISQCSGDRYQLAGKLADLMRKTALHSSPWAAFTAESSLCVAHRLAALADTWPKLASQKLSLGDTTIKEVADYYAKSGYAVDILTGDKGLKSLQPTPMPRRRAGSQ
ncbi:MAG: hypothetical protein HQL56_11555, partial [Magnetococcales bacterium]|nr:hypothetical protein [Magnetococcales bacterium]